MLRLTSMPRRGLAAGLTCPYCKDALESIASCVECESCATWLHDECFRENQGCTVLGCREQRSRTPPVRVARAVVRMPASRDLGPAPVEYGITELAVVLAFVHGSALGSLAGLASAIERYQHHAGSVALLATLGFIGVRLGIAFFRPRRVALADGERRACILSGLVTGLIGVPLVFFTLFVSY